MQHNHDEEDGIQLNTLSVPLRIIPIILHSCNATGNEDLHEGQVQGHKGL